MILTQSLACVEAMSVSRSFLPTYEGGRSCIPTGTRSSRPTGTYRCRNESHSSRNRRVFATPRASAASTSFVAAATRHAFLDERLNWQTAFLSGRRTRFPGPDGCAYCDPDWADPANAATRGDLEVLKRAARAGAFLVGPLERHGELLHVLAARMGWTAPAITEYDGAPRARISPNSKNTIGDSNDVAIRVDELPAATVARLRERHALDGALYAFAYAALDAATAGKTYA